MSRDPQLLQNEPSLKRQAASIIIITGLVIAFWFSYTSIIQAIMGGSRTAIPEQNVASAPGGNYQLDPIPPTIIPSADFRMFLNDIEFNLYAPLLEVSRAQTVKISVDFTAFGGPYSGPVTLFDEYSNQPLTTLNVAGGTGAFTWIIDSSVKVGPHLIAAQIAGQTVNFTAVGVRGPLTLNFNYITPSITKTNPQPWNVQIQGSLVDTGYNGANKNLPNTKITVALFTNPGNTPVSNPFPPNSMVTTSDTGDLNTVVILGSSVLAGTYNAQLIFSGLFTVTLPDGTQQDFPMLDLATTSIQTQLFQVIDPTQVDFSLYLNGSNNLNYGQVFNPGSIMNANASLYIGGSPANGQTVSFSILDNKGAGGSTTLGSVLTTNGWAGVNFPVVGLFTGPAVVQASVTYLGQPHTNYSFCVINNSVTLTLGNPSNTNIDFAGTHTTIFVGNLLDSTLKPVLNARLDASILYKNGNPSPFPVNPQSIFTNSAGTSSWNPATVTNPTSSTNFGLYDLQLQFGAVYDYTQHPWYGSWSSIAGINLPSGTFVPNAATNSSNKQQLNIFDGSSITQCDLAVNGTATATSYTDANIQVFNTSTQVSFQAHCKTAAYQAGQPVTFTDVTQNNFQFSTSTNSTGYANWTFTPSTAYYGSPLITGPHEITMTYNPSGALQNNYTVIFINNTIHAANLVSPPVNVVRGVTSVTASGQLLDASGNGVYKAEVIMNVTDVSGTISYSTYFQITDTTGQFAFSNTLGTFVPEGSCRITLYYGQQINALSFSHCPTQLFGANKLNFLLMLSQPDSVNATAQITGASYTPTSLPFGSNITVQGTIQWDNGSFIIPAQYSSITVRITDLSGSTTYYTQNIYTNPSPANLFTTQVTILWTNFNVYWDFRPTDLYASPTSAVAVGT